MSWVMGSILQWWPWHRSMADFLLICIVLLLIQTHTCFSRWFSFDGQTSCWVANGWVLSSKQSNTKSCYKTGQELAPTIFRARLLSLLVLVAACEALSGDTSCSRNLLLLWGWCFAVAQSWKVQENEDITIYYITWYCQKSISWILHYMVLHYMIFHGRSRKMMILQYVTLHGILHGIHGFSKLILSLDGGVNIDHSSYRWANHHVQFEISPEVCHEPTWSNEHEPSSCWQWIVKKGSSTVGGLTMVSQHDD